MRTHPYEEVTVTVELVTNEEPITTELATEHIHVKTDRAGGGDPEAPPP